MNSLLCPDATPGLFGIFDTSIAPPLLFYAYIPIFLLSLFFGFLVLFKDKKSITSKYFFAINIFFAFWIFAIIFQWIATSAYLVHFAWQILLIPEIAIYIYSVFFAYSFLYGKDIPFSYKGFFSLIVLIASALMPTHLNIQSFDLQNCQGNVGVLWQLIYVFELACLGFICLVSFDKFKNSKSSADKKKTAFFSVGLLLFLLAFWASNYFGELTKTYQINLIGPIGMIAFLAFMTYVISSFKVFNIKLFTSQILTISLWVLVGSLLFIQNIDYIHAVIGVTVIFVFLVGLQLIRSVGREIEQREKIEKLAADLEIANARLRELDQLKSEFLSFASHQIRSPLTAIGGYTSMLLEGDYGEMSDKVKESVRVIDTSSRSLIKIVNEFLDISRIEQGRMKYEFADFDAKKLTEEVVAELRPNVEKKNLSFEFSADENGDFTVSSDIGKIKQVIGNIIDNSIKYTPQGGIKVHVGKKADKILISVTDTGIGISKEDIPKLFSKFTRAKDANKTNVTGTGLGLYVAKQMLEALNGKVWIESPGQGKGSTFFIELQGKK